MDSPKWSVFGIASPWDKMYLWIRMLGVGWVLARETTGRNPNHHLIDVIDVVRSYRDLLPPRATKWWPSMMELRQLYTLFLLGTLRLTSYKTESYARPTGRDGVTYAVTVFTCHLTDRHYLVDDSESVFISGFCDRVPLMTRQAIEGNRQNQN
jgi:hypothetical protein